MAGRRIIDLPDSEDRIDFSGHPQRFLVTVDAEEEFDWTAPLQREGHSLTSVSKLARFQQFCEGFGVVPIYLVDYPLATSVKVGELLRPAIAAGQAEIGVQLHGWVNPPFDEEVNQHNSFAGNLPRELERAKFQNLRNAIEDNFGAPPRIFRSGRYGVGPNTAEILSEGGIAIDTSVRARFDYSSMGGPNFRDFPVRPYWINRAAGTLELPLTTVYTGLLRSWSHWLYPTMWRVPRLRGILARLGLMERIPLTPEGVTVAEAIRGIDQSIAKQLPVLIFSFHSPSLAPGHTPYVRNEADLDCFYDWWRKVFGHLKANGVVASSVADVLQSLPKPQGDANEPSGSSGATGL